MKSYISTKWVMAVGISHNTPHGSKWRVKEIKEKEGKKREVEKMNEGTHQCVLCAVCLAPRLDASLRTHTHRQ